MGPHGGAVVVLRSWWMIGLLWLIAVSAALCVVSPSKSFKDCIIEGGHDAAYHSAQEGTPISVKVIPWTRLHVKCGFVAADQNTGSITAIAGAIVAFFTFTLWVSTHRLWKAGEKQIEIARISADAARKSAEVAMVGQRAVIDITPAWSTDTSDQVPLPGMQYIQTLVKPNYNFHTRMDNIGGTTASNVKNFIDCILTDDEMPDSFEFPDGKAHLAQAGMLGPKRWMYSPHVPRDGYITADQIDRIQRGELNFYFFGWVKYFDSFPNTPERITKFCYLVRVTGNPQIPVTFIQHKRYNCADTGCNE
jgi:hypothetical protein